MKKLFLLAGVLFLSQLSFCGDLDDGIGVESGIKAGNDLQKDINVKYIIRKTMSRAELNSADANESLEGMGTNIGGVNMIGGRAGDITIIQDIKGDVTTIGK